MEKHPAAAAAAAAAAEGRKRRQPAAGGWQQSAAGAGMKWPLPQACRKYGRRGRPNIANCPRLRPAAGSGPRPAAGADMQGQRQQARSKSGSRGLEKAPASPIVQVAAASCCQLNVTGSHGGRRRRRLQCPAAKRRYDSVSGLRWAAAAVGCRRRRLAAATA